MGSRFARGTLNRDRLLADVLAYFAGLPGWRKSGAGYAGKSPFREDKKSSAGITDYGMYQDFASGEKWGLFAVAAKIGLDVAGYREAFNVTRYNTPRPSLNTSLTPQPPLHSVERGSNIPLPMQWGGARGGDVPMQWGSTLQPLTGVRGGDVPMQWDSTLRPLTGASDGDNLRVVPANKNSASVADDQPAAPTQNWWHTPYIPRFWRAAALTVMDASATQVIEAMHQAMVSGKIAHLFTVQEAAAATNFEYRKMDRAIKQCLEAGVFVKKAAKIKEGDSLYPNADKNATGRPQQRYTLITGADNKVAMLDALKRALLPNIHSDNTLCTPEKFMFDAEFLQDDVLEMMDSATFKELKAGVADLQTETDKIADYRYAAEFRGDTHGWKGWAAALEDTSELALNVPCDASPAEYRAAVLRALWQLDPNGRKHRRDLARELGCTDKALDGIYKRAGLRPIAQYETVILTDCTPEGINTAIRTNQRDHRGKVIYIQDSAGKRYHAYEHQSEIAAAAMQGKTMALYMRVPSVLMDNLVQAEEVPQPENVMQSDENGVGVPQLEIITPDAAPETAEAAPETQRAAKPRYSFTIRQLILLCQRLGYAVSETRITGHGQSWRFNGDTLLTAALRGIRMRKRIVA